MSKSKIRIAVVEINPRHDEIFPMWLHLARRNDYKIDFFISPRHQSRDIFSVLESPRPKCFLTSSPNLGGATILKMLRIIFTIFLRLRTLLLLKIKYDLIIANSMEPMNIFWQCFRYLNKPILAVMHNGNALIVDKRYDNLKKKNTFAVVVLSRHIQNFLTQHDIFSHPIYSFLGLRTATLSNGNKQEYAFCVQGNTDFHRRNYDSLLRAASKLKKEKVRCIFKIVGTVNRSAVLMQKRIEELDISEYFTFIGDAESYLDYYRAIDSCRFLLFLVDDSRLIYQPFFEDKCTSSLGVALGLNVIPVINSGLSEAYNIEECSVTYESDDVYSGIRSALSFDSKEIDSLRNNLGAKRQQLTDDSELEFRKALDSILGS